MDQKPQVFPTQQQSIDAARAATEAKIAAYEAEKAVVTNEIYNSIAETPDVTQERLNAVEMMRLRTQDQLNQKREYGTVIDPTKAEATSNRVVQDQSNVRNEEQMRLRDEQMRKMKEQILAYQAQANIATERNNPNASANNLYESQNRPQQNKPQVNNYQNNANQGYQNNFVPPTPPSQPPVNQSYGENPSNINPYIIEISQPNYNAPFDVIPLPSQGKLYRTKKPNINIGYLTTADENILTSPNLLASGEFLEILINRKMLEPGLRYKDLHVGDRNAIMLWLRATAYGEMYPVTLLDENDVPFDTDINLNNLATKELGAEPDENGLFDFKFPLCKAQVKFKFLTCGDVDSIEKMVDADKKNGSPIDQTNIYTMERMIVSVNGDSSRSTIREFANAIRIGDAKEFNAYVEKIESGIDLNIDVRTPGGGSIKTFLPLNINFFWPNVKL